MNGSQELYLKILRRIIGESEGKTFLDLACGEMTVTRHLKFHSSVHVDVQDRPDRPKEFTFVQGDITDETLPVFQKKYDVAFIGDGLEHLPKEKGHRLLQNMEHWAYLPIVFVPLGAYLIENEPTNNPDSHRSAWYPDNFHERGWQCEVHEDWHPTLGIGAFFAWRSATS